MLDELLGRAALKERIDDLEEENERLRKRYEAESDRRSDAVTARQDAEEQQNRLEDRIAQLEGELERVDDDDGGLSVRRRTALRGARLEEILDRLGSVRTGSEGALTAVLAEDVPEPIRDDLEDVLGGRLTLLEDAAPCLCCVDDAGLVSVALNSPVRPDLDPNWNDRFELDREWFLPTGRFALALVRADLFALGTYEGDERLDYQGFKSDVKGSHSKGGFSQARFERIRDDQIDDHLDRCREALADRDADQLYVVGQRGVVGTLVDEAGLNPDGTAAVDATGDPKPALDDAYRSFWTTTMTVF
jgi:peptide subunit release factor 1 (eRF1)